MVNKVNLCWCSSASAAIRGPGSSEGLEEEQQPSDWPGRADLAWAGHKMLDLLTSY